MATFKKITQFKLETNARFDAVNKTIRKIMNNQLSGFDRAQYPNIVDIRPGYKVTNGDVDANTMAIVFIVSKKEDKDSLGAEKLIPPVINGISTDVTVLSAFDQLRMDNAAQLAGFLPGSTPANTDFVLDSSKFDFSALIASEGRTPQIGYVPPGNIHLNEVTEEMTLICHVSPDEGWAQLSEFINSVKAGDFTVGMYDFSAPHIMDALVGIAKKGVPFFLSYDGKPPAGAGKQGNKKDDKSEDFIISEIQSKATAPFEHEKASLGKFGLWANAYHIKVAVKNLETFWLSSGNWQSSNQPVINPNKKFSTYLNNYNREWHVILTSKTLAKMYHDFLMFDIEQSRIKNSAKIASLVEEELIDLPDFPITQQLVASDTIKRFPAETFHFSTAEPLKIQPLLTPDNYMPKIRSLIESARRTLYFQNQYINIGKDTTDDYFDLLTALKDKAIDNAIDCRIILRYEPNARIMKENLVNFGFPPDKIRIQNNCHNKGILIDDEIAVVGSHNWSNYGVEWNRDASLIIYDAGVCGYYKKVFEYDWEHRATVKLDDTGAATDNALIADTDENTQVASYESLFD